MFASTVVSSLLVGFSCLGTSWAQDSAITFQTTSGGFLLADATSGPSIAVADNDWYGVQRAAQDLALDFGRVTGVNGTAQRVNSNSSSQYTIIAGTIGRSDVLNSLISAGQVDVTRTQGQWEAYQIQQVNINGSRSLVIAGADKRGTIFGIYEISQQIGVSPWWWFADISTIQQDQIYATAASIYRPSPSVKYRGIFINDEQPGLTNWIRENYPDVEYGAGFTHPFYSTVFELLLRLRANYFWPAMWGSMFYVDDIQNGKTADDYGIVMGTSHTEPLARATNEQSNFLNGTWSWAYNQQNVTEFMRQGVERAQPFETLYTLGMRGLGDVASPTLNASSLEDIVQTQQDILRDVYNTTDLTGVPQMWCLYKEVSEYFAEGLQVPDDVTLLWAEDNWGNAQRLPLANETSRSGGAGLYYHADYVGDPRDYKWINTINLNKQWYELQQAYERGAQTIWILNVGDLKPLELPITHFLDVAYDAITLSQPNSGAIWLYQWASRSFGPELAPQISQIMANYSVLAGRRKYELLDSNTYSLINYDEANTVLAEWKTLADAAQMVHGALPAEAQPGFFELILHPCLAGQLMHQLYVDIARNNIYAQQGRTSTNMLAQTTLQLFDNDHMLTQRYHELLNGKWNNMLDQTHIGYQYWQQPMRNALPPLAYVQQREISLAGPLGVTCEGTNGTVPGDDKYHSLSGNAIALPAMDPFGPQTRWIEIFNRGTGPVNYNVSCDEPAVSFSPTTTGVLGRNGSDLDVRLYVSVDWDQITNASSMATINVTTSTVTEQDYINATDHLYGNFGMPQIMLQLNKTSISDDTSLVAGTFVESDRQISMEAAHYTNITNDTSLPYLFEVPGLSRTLSGSGISLGPFNTTSTLEVSNSTPHLTYDFYTFTTSQLANLTLYFAPGLNTDPERPLQYAVQLTPFSPSNATNSTSDDGIQTIQPVPSTRLGVLPSIWSSMVADADLPSNTTWNITETGAHRLDVWLLEPGLVLQKIVLDLGGVVRSYLGPTESYRWMM
ncbi:hypothetical protein PMZ80_001559 [Knufia obscura]|uniref:Gylcosyl hydrolase 115 C-terminal domain-containing protein n=2 Tax=Knufia TaxID=430999 RepID=A0AAN8EPG3_9EURO|nr:hypothetical protein PMZ80_001559 [Knufia obscura]KAK5955617.1 hypothetical protein OHC33_003258 [Knufia fluminis]